MRPDSSPGHGRLCLAVATANDYKDATHMINEEPPVVRKKLAGWFWPLLFAPALFSVVGTTIVGLFGRSYDQLGFMVTLIVLAALPLNGICSACCAVHLSRIRTAEAKPAWLVLGT